MNTLFAFNLSLMWSFMLYCELATTIRVTIKQGTLDGGEPYTSRNGSRYYGFLGIPFAGPPIGDLRFEPPQEPEPWEGVRNATEQPPCCTQVYRHFPDNTLTVHGEENCLYLNVYTPNVNASKLLPVMVFVYGGTFSTGAIYAYNPTYLMDHPIVFVPIQHRHAVFGFLSAGDEILPGNYGMKDQVAALKWIQQNIAAFGGDPNRVTISGYSSGGMSAYLHMHSPLSSGLFQQAICMSGTAHTLGVVIPRETARERARAVGTLLGCQELETGELVKCLRKVPERDLALALYKFFVLDAFPKYPFGIVVESEIVPGAFLVKNPWQQNVINKVPLYVGINSDEGCLFASRLLRLPHLMDDLNVNSERLFPIVFQYSHKMVDPTSKSFITAAIKNFYFNNEDIREENFDKLIQLFSDCDYDYGTQEAVRRYFNEQNEAPVYYYLYSHRNSHSMSELWLNSNRNLGVCHADNIFSLFPKKPIMPEVTGVDLEVSKRMIKYLLNFLHHGDPNGDANIKLWLPIRSSNYEYLNISTEGDVMAENLRNERYYFWRNVFASTLREYFNDRFENIKTEL